ncbi:transglycosylase domain-containing protein [Cytobacillus praedii]|uniref:Peptidoglycan glycosyltransferase n=1 Tax=Cytobacillus praedii TaxID=1742358 RepID=A0A4R1B0I1_9BACI|nr:transglycosylase domain-containing protein [Cytobacillus praedii]TCJ04625.1 peptidoglycan glycosyltransferase [Cytobacillus praedii]
MKENRNLLDKLKSWLSIFTNKKTTKGASITFQVTWNLVLLFIILIVLGGSFAGGVGAGYFASLVKDEQIRPYENMKKDIYNYEETSELYFSENVYLGKLRTDLEREEVKLEDVSQHVIDAVIATEDEYFYEHDGVVPKAIMRAIFQEVTNSSVQSGGSTLTQQLIKNQLLTNEVSFERKAKEILLALRLEKFFDKKEILEAYLNVSTFGRNSSGRNIAGVQSAAKGLFGVNAKELNLPQAAFIAGLPQSPFGYTPYTQGGELKSPEGMEPGLTRMKTVLQRMFDNGRIDQKQYNEAVAYDIKKDFIPRVESSVEKYPYLTMEIEKRAAEVMSLILAEKDGYDEVDLKEDSELKNEYKILADRNLRQNGYQIHTTINKEIYDAMQAAKDSYQYYGSDKVEIIKDPETGESKEVIEPVQLGAVLIENSTGKILSFVGGRDYEAKQLNHATDTERPNGSTMKPLVVYAPAMELGAVAPGTVIPDVPVYLNPSKPGVPYPTNYDKRYSGLVSARHALKMSYNVPAMLTYKTIMDQRPAQYLEKMGFSSVIESDYHNPSLALGGITNGVTVEENVNAFGTFANNGKFIDSYIIEKIVDNSGNIIYQHEVKPVEVFSPQTAWLTIDMMRDVVKSGTANSLKSRLKFSSDWAGKTGTGQDLKDTWFVAVNPNVSFGVWTGYDTPKALELRYKGIHHSPRTIYLWAHLMNAAYDVAPGIVDPEEQFKMPGGIVRRSYCAASGLLPSEACSKAGLVESDWYNSKFVPSGSDNSFADGRYVQIGENRYMALASTPEEFTSSGVLLSPKYFEDKYGIPIKDTTKLIPKLDRWGNLLVAESKLSENGKNPGAPSISGKDSLITWSKHPEGDVIGYRVYQKTEGGAKKVSSISAGHPLSFSASNGEYYVTAVDIAGKESPPSNIIQLGKPPEKEQDVTTPPVEEKPKDPPGESENKNPDGSGTAPGDGDGDGNGDHEEGTEPPPPSNE